MNKHLKNFHSSKKRFDGTGVLVCKYCGYKGEMRLVKGKTAYCSFSCHDKDNPIKEKE
jgi:hypothetical protein